MRYAYGGEPMWCFLPPPTSDISRIPACSSCGSPRVFEMQIMPALIGYVEAAISHAVHSSGENATLSVGASVPQSPLDLSSGFEFGVVCIWSCPNSCVDNVCEVPIVQPPSDLA